MAPKIRNFHKNMGEFLRPAKNRVIARVENAVHRRVTFAGVGLICSTLAVLTCVGIASHRVISRIMRASKMRAELPHIYQAVADQRDRLTTGISLYRKTLGFYPPDHVLKRDPTVVDAITNQLFYELIGCIVDRTQQVCFPSGSSERLPIALIREFFAREIINATERSEEPRGFLASARTEPLVEIHDRPQTIVLISYWPNWEGFDGDLSSFQIGTWQYNSSSPQHNPGTYDLWLEIKIPDTNVIIGNW
jgi:hypothetical protein